MVIGTEVKTYGGKEHVYLRLMNIVKEVVDGNDAADVGVVYVIL